jgi:hypothetical protein
VAQGGDVAAQCGCVVAQCKVVGQGEMRQFSVKKQCLGVEMLWLSVEIL